ncbi:TonB-dependent receptor [Saprospiraceae bacterium]|nr:TonB-dependent receptor [Saprospiraceae bacterium]
MNKQLLTCLILLLTVSAMYSQERGKRGGRGGGQDGPRPKVKLEGRILDANTGEGLEFATISIYSKRDSSVLGGGLSGIGGAFSVESTIGRMFAEIEFIGFEKYIIDPIPFDRDAFRSGDRTIKLGDLNISSSSIVADEVTIRAEKSETQFSLDKRVFNVGKDLANRGGTAEDLLDNVPSVTVDIEGTVSLRGSDGVRILINGQPTRMTQGNGLKSIQADMIESIEVITNPSARYEAEGMAGIINIILKKQKAPGFNGSFNSSISYPWGAGLGANVNFRKNKVNLFADYNINYRSGPGGGFAYQEIQAEELFISEQTRMMNRGGLNNSVRGGIEYFISEKESLTGSIRYRIGDSDNVTTLTYLDYIGDISNTIGETLRTDNEGEDETGLTYNIDYNREFSGRDHKLTARFQYEDENEVESSDFTQLDQITTRSLTQRSTNDEGQANYSFNVDYQQPLGSKDHKYEVGWRSSVRGIDNDFKVDSLNSMGDWESLLGFTNDFEYDETIHAVYGQYGNKFGKIGFQVGLRAEYASIKTVLVNDDIRNQRDSLNFFPSVFLNYEINKGNAVQVSYSRRIRRPRFRDLNPFFSFSDPRNFYSGNPLLRPEYTDSYEMNYLKYWEKATISGGVFYRYTTDVISRIRRLTGVNTFTTQPENLGIRNDFGVEMNLSYNAIKWLRLSGNGNFFRSITTSGLPDGQLDADTYVFTSRLTSRFSFWDSDLQVRANYRSPRATPQGRQRSITSIDLGWSKDFLPKKNLTLTLSVRDLFNSRKRRYETFGEDFYSTGEFQWRQRTTTLAASYRINQKKKRGGGSRGQGGGDEGGGEF